MKMRKLWLVLILVAWFSTALAQDEPLNEVTLYPPRAFGRYDEGKASFSFRSGALKEETRNGEWDLGYGFASLGGADWFILFSAPQTRTVIKDLGAFEWTDSFQIPVLEPLPKLREGEYRSITVDTSADTGKKWAKTTNVMAKVVTGHIYVVRINDPRSDFYVTFRVEDFRQREFCRISWKRVPTPRPRKVNS